jgi:H+-translocating NAD(P) transhydrogenase subunit alpha
MIIGVLKESSAGETRVSATPSTVGQLLKLGYDVVVEAGAGLASSFRDEAYVEAGATIGDPLSADVVLGLNAPSDEQLDGLAPGTMLVGLLSPGLRPELVDDLARRKVTALAMDAVPRISRAQSLDVLSAMANIAG